MRKEFEQNKRILKRRGNSIPLGEEHEALELREMKSDGEKEIERERRSARGI